MQSQFNYEGTSQKPLAWDILLSYWQVIKEMFQGLERQGTTKKQLQSNKGI